MLFIFTFIYSNLSYAADAQQEINISAAKAEFDDKTGSATYRGHVIAQQGSRYLQSDTLTIYRDKNNKIDFMLATGTPAEFKVQPKANKSPGYGKANTIHYYPKEDKAILIDQAELIHNNDTITGNYLTYYFKQEFLQAKTNKHQRTKVTIQAQEAK